METYLTAALKMHRFLVGLFLNSDVKNADFQVQLLRRALLKIGRMIVLWFRSSDFENAIFDDAHLTNIKFENVNLKNASFENIKGFLVGFKVLTKEQIFMVRLF